MTFDPESILMAVNVGDSPVTLMYDSRTYRLEPSKPVPMPFAAAALWFGDPRAGETIQSVRDPRGLVSFVPDRETEVRRLRAKYDNQMGDERKIANHPRVELYTVPENERLYTVLDDPNGDRVIEATQTVQDQADLLTIVQRQQRQIELLMTAVSNQQTGLSPTNPGAVSQPEPEPTTMEPPHVPGVPQSPPPPVPDELLNQITNDFPEDGDVIPGETTSNTTPLAESTDLPQDTEGFATEPENSPPSKSE